MRPIQPTERTTFRRLAQRGSHERELVHAVLDEALCCHVAAAVDGVPFVIPMVHWRRGERLYFHGSHGNRVFRALLAGATACVVATLVDGIVLTRSPKKHCLQFRSVVLYGSLGEETDREHKRAALLALIEAVAPGRTADLRPLTNEEIDSTLVAWMPIEEASVKLRTEGPTDAELEPGSPTWAGVLPLATRAGAPLADTKLAPGIATPAYLLDWAERRARRSGRAWSG